MNGTPRNWSLAVVKRRCPQYVASIAACLGGLSLGCALGWSAPMTQILKREYNFGVLEANFIGAAVPAGAALGVIVVPFIIDRFGRKRTMLYIALPLILAWLMIACAKASIALYCIGRLLSGACGGMLCVVAPMYCAEISEKEIRGMVGVLFQLLLVVGILYAYCVGFTDDGVMISSLCSIAPIVFALAMAFVPESPLFYIINDKEDIARQVMKRLRGDDYDIEPEINDFKAIGTGGKCDISLLKRRPVWKCLSLAYGLMVAQQLSGINAVIFYGVSIFEMTGVEVDPLAQSVILGAVQVVGCLVSAAFVDKLGRKSLMIASEALMGVCLLALGGFFYAKDSDPDSVDNLAWVPITSLGIYILAFCLGAGPIPWAYMGEIFPSNLRGVASSSAALLNWTLAFMVTISFESVVTATSTAGVFYFFSAICILSVIFIAFCMVETKGKTFAEIQRAFAFDVPSEDVDV